VNDFIRLGHGSGGKLSHDLISAILLPAFANTILNEGHDAARFTIQGANLAFTTDSFVVKPLFFPGGDIGRLAVCGTVNDLAVSGAEPLYISASFVLETGFPLADLQKIVNSMAATAREAGVLIVTGDTKVVEKGAVDGIFINTAGLGRLITGVDIKPVNAAPGQDIIVSGSLGEHALAVMRERHGLKFPGEVISDCAPLNSLISELLEAVPQVAVMRDPTRGGLATTLNEIASQANVGILLEEELIPVNPTVYAVCQIFGYDPLYLANEGKLILFVESSFSEKTLATLHRHPLGRGARKIGQVTAEHRGLVGLRTAIGGIRLLDMLADDQLPRIC
jgi:hydrogenase expression/formation protein HypE